MHHKIKKCEKYVPLFGVKYMHLYEAHDSSRKSNITTFMSKNNIILGEGKTNLEKT